MGSVGIPYNSWPDGWGVPGTWTMTDGEPWFCCPLCKRIGRLWDSHNVSTDGTVTPSLVCSRDTCSYHEHIHLLQYEEKKS